MEKPLISPSLTTRPSLKILVIIESPHSGELEKNLAYAQACVRDSLLRGEAPIASHLLYTQEGILHDEITEERQLGMAAGWAWMEVADLCAVYCDLGISYGMELGIERAQQNKLTIHYRKLQHIDGTQRSLFI